MRSGRMDRYLTIQFKTISVGSDGAAIETWATRTKAWGERRELNMSERIQANAVQADTSARYFLRYNTIINEKDRIIDGNKTLEVIGVIEIGRGKGLELIVSDI